ncbi:hypothetical protein IAQ61_002498 [Plenodomus lingam]|uniref:uncharacterized protein n=1 Tax=Leptosphaeria maculans TaxID=5022 RepID=UPI003330808F|nr:hypothetical protein IAQ61_002498 [Plenodomus lingam]
MPPRNNPVPNAVRLFNCAICDKGYPRQLDYENHLRSYDHNHRQRLADMKKLTANNDSEGNKPKQGLDMRTINVEDANKKPGVGSRFTKIGGGAAASGSRFKKVGVAVGKEAEKKEADKEEEEPVVQSVEVDVANVRHGEKESATEAASHQVGEAQKEVLATKSEGGEEDGDEDITWEKYDFTKPTGCDHQSCPGCKTDGIWNGEWVALGPE